MCVSILRGTARQEHTAECRRRLEKELGMTERAKRAMKKVGEYVEKKMEEDEEVRRKRKSSEGKTREEPMEEEERAKVREAEKRKRDVELTADDVRWRHASVSVGSPQPARGSKKEVLRSEAGKGGGSRKRAARDEDDEEKTAKYLRKLAREAKRKERDGDQDGGREGVDEVVVAGQVVNGAVVTETEGWERWTEDGEDELDEEPVGGKKRKTSWWRN